MQAPRKGTATEQFGTCPLINIDGPYCTIQTPSTVAAMPPNALLPRHVEPLLAEALASARVVNLVGPRQSGKTTLVRDLLAPGRFVTLDDDGARTAMELDPFGQLTSLVEGADGGPVVVDEAQRLPSLALAVKRIVDAERRPGQFLLTGSSNVFTTLAVADSLAGRLLTVRLWPLCAAETLGRPVSGLLDWAVADEPDPAALPRAERLTRREYAELVVAGGYPEMRGLAPRPRRARLRDYLETLVDRDVADLLRVRRTDAFRRVIDQVAVRTGSLLNVSDLAGLVGVQRATLEQYLDVLSRLAVVTRVGTWASGETRRETGRPKLHIVDTGLACALRDLSVESFEPDADPTALGPLLESFAFNELLRAAPLQRGLFSLHHWSGPRGREVDIIAECRRRLVVIEVKASTSVSRHDLKHLDWFAGDGPGKTRRVTSILFYLGDELLVLGERRFAVPLSALWAPRPAPS